MSNDQARALWNHLNAGYDADLPSEMHERYYEEDITMIVAALAEARRAANIAGYTDALKTVAQSIGVECTDALTSATIMDYVEALRARVEELEYELRERAKDCLEHCQDQTRSQLAANKANREITDLTAQLAQAQGKVEELEKQQDELVHNLSLCRGNELAEQVEVLTAQLTRAQQQINDAEEALGHHQAEAARLEQQLAQARARVVGLEEACRQHLVMLERATTELVEQKFNERNPIIQHLEQQLAQARQALAPMDEK